MSDAYSFEQPASSVISENLTALSSGRISHRNISGS
jgi:hypothetical protein